MLPGPLDQRGRGPVVAPTRTGGRVTGGHGRHVGGHGGLPGGGVAGAVSRDQGVHGRSTHWADMEPSRYSVTSSTIC